MGSESERYCPRCIFDARGYCRNGPGCAFRHEPRCLKSRADPVVKTSDGRGFESFGNLDAESRKRRRMRDRSKAEAASEFATPECGICFEVPTISGGRYALLTCCDHAFCINCLKNWRKTPRSEMNREENVRRRCPLCRAKSDMIIPSFTFCTGGEKQSLLDQFKKKCSKIPCKYYNEGASHRGACPFGWRCIYQHRRADGSVIDNEAERGVVGVSGLPGRKKISRGARQALEEQFRDETIQVVLGSDLLDNIWDDLQLSRRNLRTLSAQPRQLIAEAIADGQYEAAVEGILLAYEASL